MRNMSYCLGPVGPGTGCEEHEEHEVSEQRLFPKSVQTLGIVMTI